MPRGNDGKSPLRAKRGTIFGLDDCDVEMSAGSDLDVPRRFPVAIAGRPPRLTLVEKGRDLSEFDP
jgi:hypothetical protein